MTIARQRLRYLRNVAEAGDKNYLNWMKEQDVSTR